MIIELKAGINLATATTIKDKIEKRVNTSLLKDKIITVDNVITKIAIVSSNSFGTFCNTVK